ncbi:MAG: 1-deoxy-D-xylulose-5-phosphate reductoisomerase [Candidatus Gastranaerophilaceae bacterium]|jgi:1-deoxy-D-xylulose-5-phosphate reductoisomerase
MKQKISILGSTGSIGKQALEVVDRLPGKFEIYGLAAGENIKKLIPQIKKYKPSVVSVKTEEAAIKLKKEISGIEILHGNEGLVEIAQNTENRSVLIAVTGIAGLYPTLAAINNNITVALANKETIVSAGSIVMERLKKTNAKIIPVDSEHSAIHQCTKNFKQVKNLIITASGGPFRTNSLEEIENATVKETLAHPKWSMGSKITVDSATLMNKGLEVIEAHHLFGVDYDNIKVVIHPQSIIHSAIEYKDGSVIAQMGIPSMHIPIQYALTYPERVEGLKTDTFDFVKIARLDFEAPDYDRFPCLKLAYEAGKKGGLYPAVLNASNEEAVYAFLEGKIKLTEIAPIVEKALENCENIKIPDIEDIMMADIKAREYVQNQLMR